MKETHVSLDKEIKEISVKIKEISKTKNISKKDVLLKINEEIGEISGEILKVKGIKPNKDNSNSIHSLYEEISDCMISVMDYMNKRNIKYKLSPKTKDKYQFSISIENVSYFQELFLDIINKGNFKNKKNVYKLYIFLYNILNSYNDNDYNVCNVIFNKLIKWDNYNK